MRYTLEYKLKCIQMYRQGIWPETPEGIKNSQVFPVISINKSAIPATVVGTKMMSEN